jgi:hypothetical protein
LLVDDAARKLLPEERDCGVILPSWETCADAGWASWHALVRALLEVEDGVDLRDVSAAISESAAAATD